MPATPVSPGPKLDYRAGFRVAALFEIGETEVMDSPVGTIDHSVGRALQLIVDGPLDDPDTKNAALEKYKSAGFGDKEAEA